MQESLLYRALRTAYPAHCLPEGVEILEGADGILVRGPGGDFPLQFGISTVRLTGREVADRICAAIERAAEPAPFYVPDGYEFNPRP